MNLKDNKIALNYSQATDLTEFILLHKRVPFIQGSPGVGKSSIQKTLCKRMNLFPIDIRLGQLEAVDLNGYPFLVNGKLTHCPLDSFPLADTPIPEGYSGWLINFGELNSCDRSVQAAAYKPILDRMINQAMLHEKCYCMADGNFMSDNAITEVITSAMVSRLTFLCLQVDPVESQAYAIEQKWNTDLVAFLSYAPEYWHKFDPSKKEEPYACPRSLETASVYANGLGDLSKGIPEAALPLFTGSIGMDAAVAFRAFTLLDVPEYTHIVKDPLTEEVAANVATQWRTVNMLAKKVTVEDIGAVLDYVDRLMPEIIVVFLKVCFQNKPSMITNPDFIQALTKFRVDMQQHA